MTLTEKNVLDAAIGAARKLMPGADEDAQAEFAATLIERLPARISAGVVQVRFSSQGRNWQTVTTVTPEEVPDLNAVYGWEKYRVVEIGVCP